jgi:amino acid transporter
MVLAYAIVCPWEAVAFGNLLGRLFPLFRQAELYAVAGRAITAPKLVAGLALTAVIAGVNLAGIRLSGLFQNVLTFGMLAVVAAFTAMGLARADATHLEPLFARPGTAGALLSILMVVQIVPYFMTGFESVGKESEEAGPGFDPRNFGRAILTAAVAGTAFYCLVVAAVSLVFPWRSLVEGKLGTEAAFERAFSSRAIANLILFAALLSLVKIFNGNFVAATRMLYGIGRRGLVHPSLGRPHPRSGAPAAAIGLMAILTAGSAFLGDALLVPVTEVGSLAVGVGWLSTCVAYLVRHPNGSGRTAAGFGAAVSAAVVAMKTLPIVPGSFTRSEWIAFACWSALGATFWLARPRGEREAA